MMAVLVFQEVMTIRKSNSQRHVLV